MQRTCDECGASVTCSAWQLTATCPQCGAVVCNTALMDAGFIALVVGIIVLGVVL